MKAAPAVGDSSALGQERDREASRRAVEVSQLLCSILATKKNN